MQLRAREFRHVVIASDFDASVAFYEGLLGMERTGGWDRPDGRGALLSAGGNAVVEIIEGDTAPTAAGVFVAIEVDHVEDWYSHVHAAGAEIAVPPHNTPWGHRAFTVRDPDGLAITFYEVVVDRPTGV